MTLNDLREQTKRAFQEYIDFRSTMMGKSTHLRDRPALNMRQCHKHSKQIVNDPNFNATTNYRQVLLKFVRVGDVYYYAKKHSVEAAMLWKLSRE